MPDGVVCLPCTGNGGGGKVDARAGLAEESCSSESSRLTCHTKKDERKMEPPFLVSLRTLVREWCGSEAKMEQSNPA
jgi:hypothetical protein